MMTKASDIHPAFAQRDSLCSLTGETIPKGAECFWVQGVGVFKVKPTVEDLEEVEARLEEETKEAKDPGARLARAAQIRKEAKELRAKARVLEDRARRLEMDES